MLLLSSLFLILIIIVNGGGQDSSKRTCSKATAEFKNGASGVNGYITVNQDGKIMINLDLSKLDASQCEDNGDGGYSYHIHERWDFEDLTEKKGTESCGADYTGKH